MGNTKKLLLVYKEMPEQTLTHPVNIMLTPQFYTLKREALPVKFAYQAKRIAPSLFEGLHEDSHRYNYFVSKEEDGWLFIAYDLEAIQEFLREKGFDLGLVSKMYFAEQSHERFSEPVMVGETEALVNFESQLVMVPKAVLADDLTYMQVDESLTPKKGISLEGGSNAFLSKKESYVLSAIFVVFAMVFVVEGFRYSGENKEEATQIEAIFEANPALQSSYTRDSIASKYAKLDKRERWKRESIKSLSHMIFKGSTLHTFKMDRKGFSAVFVCKAPKVCKKVETLAKKAHFSSKKTTTPNEIQVQGQL